MNVMVLDQNDDIEILRDLANEWKTLANDNVYGLPLDVNIFLNSMQNLKNNLNGDVLVLLKDEIIVGSFGLIYLPNHVGPGTIANERCFFVKPSARSGGIALIRAAEKLAKSKSCSFLILNSSSIAGNADRSSRLYHHCGYPAFETAHLKAL